MSDSPFEGHNKAGKTQVNKTTPCSHVYSGFQPELPVPETPSLSRQEQNVSPCKLHHLLAPEDFILFLFFAESACVLLFPCVSSRWWVYSRHTLHLKCMLNRNGDASRVLRFFWFFYIHLTINTFVFDFFRLEKQPVLDCLWRWPYF